MEKGIPFAGSIIIDQILIRSMATNKEIDISGLFIEMDIFEDLFSNFLSAQIMLSDPYNIHSALPLVGEEEVLIKCKTPTFDSKRSFDLVFYAYKMTDKTLVEMKSTVYTLHLVPKEVIVDANVRISAAMGDSCSNLVRKILTEPIFLESQTPYAIEDSGNSIQYISNYWSPTQNINYICSRATSGRDIPDYVFFQNTAGFSFISMDDLVSQEACGSYRILPPNPNRDLSRTGSIRDVESDYYTVEDFVLEEGYDYLKRLSNGMYSGRLLTHNILTKTIKTTYYDYQDEFDEIHSLESYPLNTDNLLSRKMAALAFRYNVAQSQRLQGSDIFNKIWLHRRSLLWQRNAIRGEVTVPGRTDRRVGQVIDLKIPTIEPRSQADKDFDIYDNHLSGRWLITAINHRITRTEHKMTMQIAKDSLSKEIKK